MERKKLKNLILFEEECVKKKKKESIMRKAKDKTQRN